MTSNNRIRSLATPHIRQRDHSVYGEETDKREAPPTDLEMTDDSYALYMRQVGGHRILSRTQEIELFKRFERGDISARDEIIRCNLKLVSAVARSYVGRGLSLIDMCQEGNIGLMHAATKFDWRKGFKFSTYATWWIKQAVHRAIQRDSGDYRLPIHIADRARRVSAFLWRWHGENLHTRDPTTDEIAAGTGLLHAHVEQIQDILKRVHFSIDALKNEDGESFFEIPDYSAEEAFDKAEENAPGLLSEMLEKLPERERLILEMRYGLAGNGADTLERIGITLGVTRERVRQLERCALKKLEALGYHHGLSPRERRLPESE